MDQKRRLIFYFLIPVIFFTGIVSCEDEISWEVEDTPEMLVVEGSLTSELKKHRITLTKSADYFSNKKTPAVTGADVNITAGSQIIDLIELPDSPGVYETAYEVAGIPGNLYSLNIFLDEAINGKTEYHAEELMYNGIDLDSVKAFVYDNPMYIENEPIDSILLVIILYGFEPKDEENLYLVKLYKNGELLQDTIDEIQIYSDSDQLSGEYVNSMLFFESFQPRDTIGVELSSVSESFMQFATGIINIAEQSGNPFDLVGPPANAIGNVDNGKALGYFMVSYVSKAQAVVEDRREK